MSGIRHSVQLWEATCTRSLGLSGIGTDTLGCTGIESELQMGYERGKENTANQCEVSSYAIKPRRDGIYFYWCGPRIMLDYGYTCHFNAICGFSFQKSRLMTLNDFNSPLHLTIFFVQQSKVALPHLDLYPIRAFTKSNFQCLWFVQTIWSVWMPILKSILESSVHLGKTSSGYFCD